jgi:hypothetical protein
MAVVPTWTPSLQQDTPDGRVYFSDGDNYRYNIYSLSYTTTFTLLPGTFTFPSTATGAGYRDTDVPRELVERRSTLIGVIPLINLLTDNTSTPILFSFPSNGYAVSVVSFDRDYYVIPQASGSPDNELNPDGLYKNPGAADIRLPYRTALVINGIYDVSGGFRYGETSIELRMEMKQAASPGFLEKKILLPVTITKSATDISLNSFTGTGSINPRSTPKPTPLAFQSNSIPDTNGNIVREYVNGFIDLNFADFASTTRKNIQNGETDDTQIEYYLSLTDPVLSPRVFVKENEYIRITGNRIIFKKSTGLPTGGISIPIKFLQEETPMYRRSAQRVGDTMNGNTTTISIIIEKSTPLFDNQLPAENTGILTTVYRLPDMNKMTTERSFVLIPPNSNNTDTAASFSFSSSNENLLKIVVSGSGDAIVYTAFLYGSGTATVTVTQSATTNFNQKVATFNVNIFEITPAVINCNTNLFYTNPYNRQFWTRFKPECRSSDLVDSVSGQKLSVSQVDEVYDMRRKAEILKYDKNVGGLTKKQKYAKASRGELMRNIGNSTKYVTDTSSPFALICPPSAVNSRILCGLTTACGVPGKERLLCYDPSVNLYNYKRTYQYEAGLQLTSNIPTTLLTEPTNLRIGVFDNENNSVTLYWDAPNSNGGFPITGYVITYSVDNKTWIPYESVFPYQPAAGEVAAATYNQISGEINGNSVVFQRKPGSIDPRDNTIYYISVFSGNVRGLSSVPATVTMKTSSVPSIIKDFGFTNAPDERQNLMVDLKWTDPVSTGSASGGGISSYNGPPITMYNLYYRKVPDTMWTKLTLDITSTVASTTGATRRYVLRNLMNQNKYEIKIEPINRVGVGPESAIITARTLMKPGIPTNVSMTAKFGLLPPLITDISRNYISITWNRPDSGGTAIKYYNITITPPAIMGSNVTYAFNIDANDIMTTYNSNIATINNNMIVDGSYSVVIESNNGYLPSIESARAFVAVNPSSATAIILNINGYYSQSGLEYAEMTFTINTEYAISNTISYVRVNGLNSIYDLNPPLNIDRQPISGTGEHKIRIPASSGGRDIIVVGTEYRVTITFVFQNGEQRTSELFNYTPEIRYISL